MFAVLLLLQAENKRAVEKNKSTDKKIDLLLIFCFCFNEIIF